MSARLFVGAISGTSVDGLDLAVLDASTPPSVVAGRTAPIPTDLTRLLKNLGSGAVNSLDSLGEADNRVGTLIGTSIRELLSDLSLDSGDIVAVGSHGQTVRHRSEGSTPFSLQIGDPNLIAEITGIDTVADFRRRDMAVGGQGAPLVPPFHEALFRTRNENRTVLNIGGIANISSLPADATLQITGFDTGPGNALMDAWAERHLGVAYDQGGAWARTGINRQDAIESTAQRSLPSSPSAEEHRQRALQSRVARIERRDRHAQPRRCPGDACRTDRRDDRAIDSTMGASDINGRRMWRGTFEWPPDGASGRSSFADSRDSNRSARIQRRLDRSSRLCMACVSHYRWSTR